MDYVLTDGKNNYIRYDTFSGKYVPVRNEALAEHFDQRLKAKNILNNAVPKRLRKGYYIQENEDSKSDKRLYKEQTDLHIDEVKKMSKDSMTDSQIQKWETGIEKIADFVQESEDRREELKNALSIADKEIIDIEHYIEFSNLNAYQGYLSYKMLQNRLKKRRKIKNEMKILNELGNCKMDATMIHDIKRLADGLKNQTYTPRVLVDLFR